MIHSNSNSSFCSRRLAKFSQDFLDVANIIKFAGRDHISDNTTLVAKAGSVPRRHEILDEYL